MTPTKKQLVRRGRSFTFNYKGRESWFYLCEDGASFHQPAKNMGTQDVFGLPITKLIEALKACGYIAS